MRLGTLGLLAAAVAGLLAVTSQVKANSIDFVSGPQLLATDGATFWTYGLHTGISNAVPTNNSVEVGDSFALYNIPGLMATSFQAALTQPANWVPTVSASAPTYSSGPNTIDDGGSATPDILYTYSSPGASIPGYTDLGLFEFTTTTPLAATPIFGGAQYHHGTSKEINTITVPVPVPAAAWMGLSTLAGLAGMGIVRRRRSA